MLKKVLSLIALLSFILSFSSYSVLKINANNGDHELLVKISLLCDELQNVSQDKKDDLNKFIDRNTNKLNSALMGSEKFSTFTGSSVDKFCNQLNELYKKVKEDKINPSRKKDFEIMFNNMQTEFENLKDSVKNTADDIKDAVVNKAKSVKDSVVEKGRELKDSIQGKSSEVKDRVESKGRELRDSGKELKDSVKEKSSELKDKVESKGQQLKDSAKKKGSQLRDSLTEKEIEAEEKLKRKIEEDENERRQ